MIEVLSKGFYTTIQDLGRFNFTHFGVPLSGAMDTYLFNSANLLVGNQNNEAQLEMTLMGPKLKFLNSSIITVTAFKANVFINGNSSKTNHLIEIKADDILEVKNIQSRAYLSVAGGFKTEFTLGSRSQYQSITKAPRINKGDVLKLNQNKNDFEIKHAALKLELSKYNQNNIAVYPMPEYKLLDTEKKQFLKQMPFTISNESNRMAYQLNEKIENNLIGITSKPVMPGVVQLTPEGKLIILMRDAQVTGGYPRIFQVAPESLNILAQKSTNQTIMFKLKNPI